jgi:hypothetical protein
MPLTTRGKLADAWRRWEADEDAFSLDGDIHALIDDLRTAPTPADQQLLAAWDRWQADPDHVLPPAYLHHAFADWLEATNAG